MFSSSFLSFCRGWKKINSSSDVLQVSAHSYDTPLGKQACDRCPSRDRLTSKHIYLIVSRDPFDDGDNGLTSRPGGAISVRQQSRVRNWHLVLIGRILEFSE